MYVAPSQCLDIVPDLTPNVRNSLEINVGIIAASVPTLKPLFNQSRRNRLRHYLQHRKTLKGEPESLNIPSPDDDDDRVKLTFASIPNALPRSVSYYQGKHNEPGKSWEKLEFQTSAEASEKKKQTATISTVEMSGEQVV